MRHTPHKPFVTLAATPPAPPETLLPADTTAPPCCIQGVATSQFVGVAAHEPERRPRQGSGVRHQFVAWATAHPRAFAQTAVPPARETANKSEDLPRNAHHRLHSPSALSSKASFGTTRNEQTAPPLPCSGSARLPPAPTQATLPPDRISITRAPRAGTGARLRPRSGFPGSSWTSSDPSRR